MKKSALFLLFGLLCCGTPLLAGEADIIKVDVKKNHNASFEFSVTVFHEDSGWDHYVNKWEVIGDKDVVYGTRTLHHPHVGEQPFTRSLSGVAIPASVQSVTIRGHDSGHQYGGKVVSVQLP